jgi:hypothetical protein
VVHEVQQADPASASAVHGPHRRAHGLGAAASGRTARRCGWREAGGAQLAARAQLQPRRTWAACRCHTGRPQTAYPLSGALRGWTREGMRRPCGRRHCRAAWDCRCRAPLLPPPCWSIASNSSGMSLRRTCCVGACCSASRLLLLGRLLCIFGRWRCDGRCLGGGLGRAGRAHRRRANGSRVEGCPWCSPSQRSPARAASGAAPRRLPVTGTAGAGERQRQSPEYTGGPCGMPLR